MRKPLFAGFAVFLAILCLGRAGLFGAKIYTTCKQDTDSEQVYDQLAQYVSPHEATTPEGGFTPPSSGAEPVSEREEAAEPVRLLDIDFAALKEINPDIVGWLYCPDTVINYPLVQGADNAYYLSHLADGTYNRNGCLFVDCHNRAGFADENTLIYGHHMASGKMFASLIQYADQSYYEAHPVIYLMTEDTDYRVELFAGYTATVDAAAYTLTFSSAEEYDAWLLEVVEQSDFSSGVSVDAGDHTVTFSTCAYSFQDARYVVHGKLVDD